MRQDTMTISFNMDDVGKRVTTAGGKQIGTVTDVTGGCPSIDPTNDLCQQLREQLGWSVEGTDEYRLEPAAIASVTDDELVLQSVFTHEESGDCAE